MPEAERRIWICANCGETNVVMPGECSVCGHPRTTENTDGRLPAPWEPTLVGWEPVPAPEIREPEPMPPWTPPPRPRPPATAPGFRTGPPPAPRNAPPAVAAQPRAAQYDPEPEVIWIPEAADPDEPEPPRRSRLVPVLPVAVLVAALAAAALLAVPRLLRSAGETPVAVPTRTTTAAPRPTATVENTPVRLVTVHRSVSDPRAAGVAAMFETYFAGINEKDYATVAGVFDPSGEFDPGDPDQMAAFSDGTATAKDSDVVLRRLADLPGGRLRADVTFRSEQEAGDGPEERPAETCTIWRVSYTLSGAKGAYRIVLGDGASRPC